MKKIITTFVVIMLVFTMAIPAFAVETSGVLPRNSDNSFLVSSEDPSDSFKLDRAVYANKTNVRFDLNRNGPCEDTDVITLKFTNTATHVNYYVAIRANDIGVNTRTIGVTIPAGNYNVSIANTPCYIYSLSGVFDN